jgi:hypothetical protein
MPSRKGGGDDGDRRRREFDPAVIRRVQNDAYAKTAWERGGGSNLYVQRDPLAAGEVIRAQRQEIPVDRETIMVFADDEPLLNWGHRCRYFLYDAADGTHYGTVNADFPPYLVDIPESYEAFHLPIQHAHAEILWPGFRLPGLLRDGPGADWYAVLFSGASNNRHTNDLEFLYRTLTGDYGVDARRIYVLNYDGTVNYSGGPHPVTSWPGDGSGYTMPVHGEGTKADLDAVLDELKGRLGPEDKLLIHTNNHGGHNGESYLVTYSGPDYGASDFADKLAELPKHHCMMVMMEQCYAGGFNAGVVASSPAVHTSIASAADEWHTSIGGDDFDPYARDWIAAMHGATPSGGALAHNPDSDSNGLIGAEEAFDYATAVKHPHDTPVYAESSWAAGECHLGKDRPWWWYVVMRKLIVRRKPGPIPEELDWLERSLPEIHKVLKDTADREGQAHDALESLIEEIATRE